MRKTTFVAAVAVAAVGAALPAYAANPLPTAEKSKIQPHNESVSAWDPSASPQRLTDFVEKINKSVVTVYCGRSLGSGWAAVTGLSDEAVASGYKSYIITNAHVVQGCTSNATRYIEIRQNGIAYPARVWSWDWDVDLAGIMTTADLPELRWGENPRPRVGQWVAAFGSPLGLAGSATFGYASYVGKNDLISSAPINRGNSGGPLVDNEGRVIGINTAGIDGTNSIGIVQGTPLMCVSTHNCRNSTTVWLDGTTPSAPIGLAASQQAYGALVAWSEPMTDGGQPVSRYRVTAQPGDQQCTTYGTKRCSFTNQGKKGSGLVPGTTYTFTVQAFNEIGAGQPATVTYTHQGPPGVVRELRATSQPGAVRITWSAPAELGGAPSVTYRYRVGKGKWTPTSAPRATVSGSKGKRLNVTVQAVNTAGPGPGSTVIGTPR